MTKPCKHDLLQFEVSEYGRNVGFKSTASLVNISTSGYPAPLVLPGDALTDPDEQYPQSYKDFLDDEDRNEVTSQRQTIYLVSPPTIDASVSFMREWLRPASSKSHGASTTTDGMIQSVSNYTSAFFHPMPVKLYDKPIRFQRQGTSKTKTKTPARVDVLFDNNMLLDVGTRPCPDDSFPRQLNLNDLLDVLINALPKDAYAMMMLVDHDLYEEEEDLFQCGRAYGASRVAVVSLARYNPALDKSIGLDLAHCWPASHCSSFVKAFTTAHESEDCPPRKKRSKPAKVGSAGSRRLRGAIDAYTDAMSAISIADEATFRRLWLSRVCRTVTHELGHCLGIDHCTYHACLMQATSGLLEDARQPLYLCPEDEKKLLHFNNATGSSDRAAVMIRLLETGDWLQDPTFAAFTAWLSG